MQDQTNIPARSTSRKIPASGSSNPFRLPRKQLHCLRALKRGLVRLGGSGRRVDFEFVRRVFAEIPELRSA
jgi:hypothetical protein